MARFFVLYFSSLVDLFPKCHKFSIRFFRADVHWMFNGVRFIIQFKIHDVKWTTEEDAESAIKSATAIRLALNHLRQRFSSLALSHLISTIYRRE